LIPATSDTKTASVTASVGLILWVCLAHLEQPKIGGLVPPFFLVYFSVID